MKFIIFLTFWVLSSGFLKAQTQGASYTDVGRGVATTFVTDYHALGINTSALGIPNRYGKKFTTGMTEFNLGLYSDSLSVDRLKSLYGASQDTCISMWVADMDFNPPQAVITALEKEVKHGVFGYYGSNKSFINSIKLWMKSRHDWDINKLNGLDE